MRWMQIFVTLLLVAADDPQGVDDTQVRLNFTNPSKWVAIRGWYGETKIEKASVLFKPGNDVEIQYSTGRRINESIRSTVTRAYALDPHSGVPVVSPISSRGIVQDDQIVFRMVGERLEMTMQRRLHLILKRAE